MKKKGVKMARALPQGFRRKKNGSIEYRFMIGEQRFSVSGSTVKECRQKEREKAAKVAAGQYVRNEKVTLGEYYKEWEKAHAGTVKESTLNAERVAMRPVLARIGGEKVAKLERRQIIALQDDLKKSYTTTGVNYRITTLGSVLRAAVLDGILARNPCEGVKRLKRTEPKARDTIHRALTQEEQTAFFDAAASEWLYELLCFLVLTGCRVGETLALHWSDIDYKRGLIHIRRTVIRSDKGQRIGDSTKSKSGMRDIPLTEDIRETLRRQRQKVRDLFGDVVSLEQAGGLVFVTSRQGTMVDESTVARTVYRIADKAGIDRISTHCLRDTFATRAIESGMNPQTLKELLGHSSYSMTMDLYAHVMENTKKEEMNRVRIII